MAGLLFIVSGPSGVGKGSIIQGLLVRFSDLSVSVSATTRPPRPGEVHGVHYYFISEEEFRRKIAKGEFIEWVKVHGAYYGTPKQLLEQRLNSGNDLVLDIEVNGAQAVKQYFPDAILIFVTPPSLEDLDKRLVNRKTEGETARFQRLSRAEEELQRIQEYDYIVVNEDLEPAVCEVAAIITAEKCRNKTKKGGNTLQ